MKVNLTTAPKTRVDLEAAWHRDLLFVTLIREDQDLGRTTFQIALDDTDLEHLISTLIEQQR